MEGLLWALMVIGVLVVLGSLVIVRRLPAELRLFAIVPSAVVLVGFGVGFLALSGVFG